MFRFLSRRVLPGFMRRLRIMPSYPWGVFTARAGSVLPTPRLRRAWIKSGIPAALMIVPSWHTSPGTLPAEKEDRGDEA